MLITTTYLYYFRLLTSWSSQWCVLQPIQYHPSTNFLDEEDIVILSTLVPDLIQLIMSPFLLLYQSGIKVMSLSDSTIKCPCVVLYHYSSPLLIPTSWQAWQPWPPARSPIPGTVPAWQPEKRVILAFYWTHLRWDLSHFYVHSFKGFRVFQFRLNVPS